LGIRIRGNKKNKKTKVSATVNRLYSDAVRSERRLEPRSVSAQDAKPVVKKTSQPSRARNCCGKKVVSVSGMVTTATFTSEEVRKAKPLAYAFSGETLIYAPSVRDNTCFEIHYRSEVRRTHWANSKFFEFANNLVQLPAGLKVYLCMPKVAGTTRAVRLRLDGRTWWRRGDITALTAAFNRAIDKLTIATSAPVFRSGKVSRSRRRNHRGKGSLNRRREKRKQTISKLNEIAAKSATATQAAAAVILEQQSVQLAKDTFKQVSELVTDLVAMNGPVLLKQLSETQLPGVHQHAISARNNPVEFIKAHYTRPLQMPKYYLKSRHNFDMPRVKKPVPCFLILDEHDRLSVSYTVGEDQEVVPILVPEIVDNYTTIVPRSNIISTVVKHLPHKQTRRLV